MKILIADDEELVRENLLDILRGLAQADSVSEAMNGRTLIEKAREIRPDICFVDIRMPGINGLEAIETLTDEFPDISWIILSGYSDFDYARKALSLGVSDYLLKPPTEAEVEAALAKAAEKRLDAGRLKREKFEYRVSGVLNNSSAVEFDEFLQQAESYAAVVYIPDEKDSGFNVEQQSLLKLKLRDSLDQNWSYDYAGAFVVMEEFQAIIAAGHAPLELLNQLSNTVAAEIGKVGKTMETPVLADLPSLLGYIENNLPQNADKPVPFEDNPERSARIVQQAEILIKQQYTKPIGVAQIAEQLNVTPNYLSSLFKRYKNESFTKFITDLRLEEAGRLLLVPGMTVKNAAQQLGYMSSRHFARLFRERYGISPSDYRK